MTELSEVLIGDAETPGEPITSTHLKYWTLTASRSDESVIEERLVNYESLGLDPNVCELCGGPTVRGDEPWKRGLDGASAHVRCLKNTGAL